VAYKTGDRKDQIKKFLLMNPNSQFKGIFDHLKKNGLGYNHNKGLDKMLKSMIDSNEIIKNEKSKPYPTYDVVNDSSFASAIKGEFFRKNLVPFDGRTLKDGIEKCYFHEMGNPNIDDDYLNYSKEEKFVKYMIMRYGFFLLSIFVKGHEHAINDKNFDKIEWMKHALNLFQDEKYYSKSFLQFLIDKKSINDSMDIDKKKLKSKLRHIKKIMKEFHPEQYFDFEQYEKDIVNDFELIKEIKLIEEKSNKKKSIIKK